MFRKFCKYEFRKVSQTLFFAVYVCFARFARFRKFEFRKVSQFSVSQEFANRFFVSQLFKVSAMGSLLMGAAIEKINAA